MKVLFLDTVHPILARRLSEAGMAEEVFGARGEDEGGSGGGSGGD